MNTQNLPDRELVRRILSGHPDLFGPLVERHIRAAHAIAYARLGNAADAEDAVQEAFLRAYERLASLRDPEKFAAWLLTIARHEAARVAAKRNRSQRLDANLAPRPLPLTPNDQDPSTLSTASTTSTPSTTPDPAQHELNAILRDHVMRLPESAREVLLLHYFAGHSARDIATLLDLRRPAVLKRLQRAREALAETMLRDLEVARPSSEGFTKQAVRISGLVTALGLPASVSGVATASVAGTGIGISLKILTASAVLVAAGAVVGVAAWRNTAKSTHENTAASQTAATQPIANTTPALEEFAAPVNAAPATIQPTTERAKSSAFPKEPATHAPKSLSGVWTVEVTDPDNEVAKVISHAIKQVTIEDRGQTLDLFANSSPEYMAGTGSVHGDIVEFELASNVRGEPQNSIQVKLEAPYDRATFTMKLRGTASSAQYSPASEGRAARLENPLRDEIEMVWQRVPETKLSRSQYIEARKKELGELARAYFKYRFEHQARPPATLEQLVPGYLPDFHPYTPEAGVLLTYTPPPPGIPFVPNESDYDTNVEDGAARQARMMQVEQSAQRRLAALLDPTPIVYAVYDRFDLVLVITRNGYVGAPDEVACQHPVHVAPLTDRQKADLIESCQNNMKQLGLSLKMFANEDRENRFPAGWFMIYPEYMPDPCIAVCPGAPQVEVAYEILFPAVTTVELAATYDSLFPGAIDPDSPDGSSRRLARIPLVIELHECSESGGYNVLFLDGHVEHRKGSLESYPDLAPFLNLH